MYNGDLEEYQDSVDDWDGSLEQGFNVHGWPENFFTPVVQALAPSARPVVSRGSLVQTTRRSDDRGGSPRAAPAPT